MTTRIVLDLGGSNDLSIADCPACTHPVRDVTWDQPALLRFGGYGATRRIVQRTCDRCGWTLRIRIDETRPDREGAA